MVRGTATVQKIRELVQEHQKGNSMLNISQTLNLAKSTVADITKRFWETGNVNIEGKSTGRPKLVTPGEQRKLVKV